MPAIPTTFPFSPAELDYLYTSLSATPPIRPDLRAPTDFRPLSAETGVLPAANGSAHVSFADGGEAVVGVRGEVEKTSTTTSDMGDAMDVDVDETKKPEQLRGRPEWITLTLTLPGARDDDAAVVFLEEMLREAFIVPSPTATATSSQSLQDKLVINSRWHFHLYLDVVLISSGVGIGGVNSSPLPLLSMAIYLALMDTRMPMLKSMGEEDPVFEDDWERARWLFDRAGKGKGAANGLDAEARPPVTLLVIVVGENIIFDPSREELSVADAVVGVSVGVPSALGKDNTSFTILALRTLDTAARDTMPGVPRDEAVDMNQGEKVEGVWRPKTGGVKRSVLGKIVKTVVGGDGVPGVAGDVLKGLEGFLMAERERDMVGG
jgi:exosome complex component RRP42